MTEEFKKGDKVRWKSHGGEAHGTVEKKQTSRTMIKGHTVAASPEKSPVHREDGRREEGRSQSRRSHQGMSNG